MSKTIWKGSALLAPVPPALVTCGTMEQPNILTIAWTGIICTHPAMTYIAVRPSRYSYEIIKNSKEFVINLPTSSMSKITDFCGMKSGAKINKIKYCNLEISPASVVKAPVLTQCPVSLECQVSEIKSLGTHDMFLANIVAVQVEDKYINRNGKLNLQQAGLLAYAHGEYFALGRKCGEFGFSVKKKHK
ncbi:MAG: flavin reductase family protein, partial [Oscillospiraceae bacterium]|nr:flavin reductase family protein [Oscillospiraceae bacterium]